MREKQERRCNVCRRVKDVREFKGKNKRCNACGKKRAISYLAEKEGITLLEATAIYEKRQKEKNKLEASGMKVCNMCKEIKPISNFNYMRDSRTKSMYLNSRCTACVSKYNKEYREKHLIRIEKRRRIQKSERYHGDPYFYVGNNVRVGLRRTLQLKFPCRGRVLSEMLGVCVPFFLKMIELQFENGMTWDNYGKVWCFGLRTTVSEFKRQQIPASEKVIGHWTNVFPLPIEDRYRLDLRSA